MLGLQALYKPVRHQVESTYLVWAVAGFSNDLYDNAADSYHVSVHLDKGKVVLTNLCVYIKRRS